MNVRTRITTVVYCLTPAVLLASLFIGPSQSGSVADFLTLCGIIPPSGNFNRQLASTILFDVRLPRIILVWCVGCALAVSGCSLQAVFRNPLVDPYVLGLSSGAAFGAALALALALPFVPVHLSAFVFGSLAAGLSYFFARRKKTVSIVSLILAGIIVNGVFTALLTIVQFFSDPFKLQTIIHWTMGNFHNAAWKHAAVCTGITLPATALLLFYSWRMNILSLGDEEARASGVAVGRDRVLILATVTMASSAAVAAAGIIGLYGLAVPHIVRMVAGVDNRKTLPLNAVLGGCFLVVIDDLSRSLGAQEIPIGVFTMLIGAPVFLYLMRRGSSGWEG